MAYPRNVMAEWGKYRSLKRRVKALLNFTMENKERVYINSGNNFFFYIDDYEIVRKKKLERHCLNDIVSLKEGIIESGFNKNRRILGVDYLLLKGVREGMASEENLVIGLGIVYQNRSRKKGSLEKIEFDKFALDGIEYNDFVLKQVEEMAK